MDFELPEELAELQATVRRLAQDKVKPRAREIDETGEYPQDLFEIFRRERFRTDPAVTRRSRRSREPSASPCPGRAAGPTPAAPPAHRGGPTPWADGDRKSTRLNSSHVKISYA